MWILPDNSLPKVQRDIGHKFMCMCSWKDHIIHECVYMYAFAFVYELMYFVFLRACTWVCVCLCVWSCVWVCLSVCLFMCGRTSVHMWTCVDMCGWVGECVLVCVCSCVCLFSCDCLWMNVYAVVCKSVFVWVYLYSVKCDCVIEYICVLYWCGCILCDYLFVFVSTSWSLTSARCVARAISGDRVPSLCWLPLGMTVLGPGPWTHIN